MGRPAIRTTSKRAARRALAAGGLGALVFGGWLCAGVVLAWTAPDLLAPEGRLALLLVGATAIGGAGSGLAAANERIGRFGQPATLWCLGAAALLGIYGAALLFVHEEETRTVGVAVAGTLAVASIHAGLTLLSFASDSRLPRVATSAGVSIALAGGTFAVAELITGLGLVAPGSPLADLVMLISLGSAGVLGLSWLATGVVLIGSRARR